MLTMRRGCPIERWTRLPGAELYLNVTTIGSGEIRVAFAEAVPDRLGQSRT